MAVFTQFLTTNYNCSRIFLNVYYKYIMALSYFPCTYFKLLFHFKINF